MDKIEKMFLDLNSVLVKFWKDQGRPDKEVKIALLERMLNWYKKMGYITLDTLSEEPDKSLEEAAYNYSFDSRPCIYGQVDVIDAFIAGAEWQASQMLKDAVEGEVMTNGFYPYEPRIVAPYPSCPYAFGDKVRIVVLKEEE